MSVSALAASSGLREQTVSSKGSSEFSPWFAHPLGQVCFAQTTDSTNTALARAFFANTAGHGQTFVTNWQSKGRGRDGHAWLTQPGSALLTSTLLFLPSPTPISLAPLCAGVALLKSLKTLLPAESSSLLALKWPNDIELGGGKLAGILGENLGEGHLGKKEETGNWIILGLGLNLDWAPSESQLSQLGKTGLAGPSAYLTQAWQKIAGPAPQTPQLREQILYAYLNALAESYQILKTNPGQIVEEAKAHCSTLGREITAYLPERKILRGRALTLKSNGSLLVKDENSQLHELNAAHIRVRSIGGK